MQAAKPRGVEQISSTSKEHGPFTPLQCSISTRRARRASREALAARAAKAATALGQETAITLIRRGDRP